MLVDGAQRPDGRLAFGRLISPDQDAVRLLQVFDRRPLRQELRVGQNLKSQDGFQKRSKPSKPPPPNPPGRSGAHMQVEAGLGVGVKYSPDALGGSDWDRALLRDDLIAVGHLHDPAGARLNELQVGGATLPHPVGLCGGVDLVGNLIKG